MYFRIPSCLLLLLLVAQCTFALTFGAIGGPYATNAQVPLNWVLDGTEPINGWELWFGGGGRAQKLGNIPFGAVSIVVAFPGFNGTFQGLTGTTVLAVSSEVDALSVPTTPIVTATETFSVSETSGTGTGQSTPPVQSPESTSGPDNTTTADSNPASVSQSHTTEALLGIIVGTLAVIAIIVVASIMLFVSRRRRNAKSVDTYPFAPEDVEKQLAIAKRITPFPVLPPETSSSESSLDLTTITSESRTASPPPRTSSRIIAPLRGPAAPATAAAAISISSRPMGPRAQAVSAPLTTLPQSATASASDARRTAYLNAQLEKIALAQAQERPDDDASVAYFPMSSVPSEAAAPLGVPRSPQHAPPLPPDVISSYNTVSVLGTSRRDAYLSQQLARLDTSNRTPNESGSVMFSPLSTVPSDTTATPTATQPYPQPTRGSTTLTASTVLTSPILFRRPSESDVVLSPQTPRPYVPPW
ncbi:hypothetical protein MKEN_00246500 [Mycena kentingensis (nom. inval.)]|nr:hypothetical protein MKEN_00246500 [Mycena kentingensis (nom. inval.)]